LQSAGYASEVFPIGNKNTHVIEYKNPGVWLEVARAVTKSCQNVRFIWGGNGPLLSMFKDITAEDDLIHFIGLVDDTTIRFQTSTIYYQPSLIETQGIAVLEAMLYRLPSVVSRVGGLPESIEHNYNGILVNPTDVQEHTKALIELLDNEGIRNYFGSNSYKKYLDCFSPQAFELNLDKVYKKSGLIWR
jgi:glycosyltransferase involved in cell wall biosynthesis